MYDYKHQNNLKYFNKKTKKNKKFKYVLLTVIITFSCLICLNIFFNKPIETQNKDFVQHKKNDDALPPEPKEKWKYVKKLQNL